MDVKVNEFAQALAALRAELGRQVSQVLEQCGEEGKYLPGNCVRNSLALLRLFTTLRGIAGMKFSEEESALHPVYTECGWSALG